MATVVNWFVILMIYAFFFSFDSFICRRSNSKTVSTSPRTEDIVQKKMAGTSRKRETSAGKIEVETSARDSFVLKVIGGTQREQKLRLLLVADIMINNNDH